MNKTWFHTGKTKSEFIRILIANLFLTLFICSSFNASAQSTPPRSLLALSKADHVLAIIDPVTLKIIAKVPVGSDPHEVIASADGKTAWVTIYGGGSLHELTEKYGLRLKVLKHLDIMIRLPASWTGAWVRDRIVHI
jgi:YVTN family beta-propeller protein